jgi:hypothetical protein
MKKGDWCRSQFLRGGHRKGDDNAGGNPNSNYPGEHKVMSEE